MRGNRVKKIVVGILLTIIILIDSYIVLVIKGILPNPLLDTSDLVCVLANSGDFNGADRVLTFKFDEEAKIKNYIESYVHTYETEEEANDYYQYFKGLPIDEVSLNKNTVTLSYPHGVEKNKGYYNKTKKEMKKIYVEELFYECK